jgi:phospholipid transport system substrate-binding protein
MKRAWVALWGFLLVVGIAVAADAQTPPDQVAREAIDKIIRLIKAHRDEYARDHKKLYDMVDREVLQYFDFKAMGRSVLGRYWREANEQQREQFTKEFRDLLVRTYATALLKYTNEEVKFLPYRAPAPEDKTASVRTEVIQPGGPSIQINYSFYRSDQGWKVYDVAIEGVSLVTNYRGAYAEKVRTQGLDPLIASIAEANRKGQVDPNAIAAPKPKQGEKR